MKNSKELLTKGVVVELNDQSNKKKNRIGIVNYGEGWIDTAYGNHSINELDDNLKSVNSGWDVNKVYQNTDDGLKIIWERGVVDWSTVDVDARVEVSDDGEVWVKRHFSKYENNIVFVFPFGSSSFTFREGEMSLLYYKFARLYEGK